jgi:hypothetical protein
MKPTVTVDEKRMHYFTSQTKQTWSGNNQLLLQPKIKSVSVYWKTYDVSILRCRRSHPCWINVSTTIISANAHCNTMRWLLRLFARRHLDICRDVWSLSTIMPSHIEQVGYRSCCSRFNGNFWTFHPIVLISPFVLLFVWTAEATLARWLFSQWWGSGNFSLWMVAYARVPFLPRRNL